MQNTTHYNLTKAEGTDTVNLLTQCYPNFDTIDAAMYANKQGSVGTATEVTTGTVHAITRNNADSDVFRFTATSAWTAGDTMSLDGVGVNVHLADGTTPATGAYIIGAEVLGVVNGSLVTLFLSSAIQSYVSSFNSRTGTVSPQASDYDASMIDYDNTVSGLNATDVQSAIDEIASGSGGVTYIEAWVNPDPASDFAAGNIVIDSNDYDYLVWDVIYTGSYHISQMIPKGSGTIFNISAVSSGTYISAIQRNVVRTNDTTFSVGVCYEQNTGTARTTNNSLMKPNKIYRVKL